MGSGFAPAQGLASVSVTPEVIPIEDLLDVDLTAIADGDYLRYDGGLGNFVNTNIGQILIDLLTVDGPGSGLNADFLDGLDPSAISAQSGWQDDGIVVRLVTLTDTVAIGSATMSGTEKLRVVGDSRFEGKLTVTGVIDPTQVLLSGGDKKYGATDAGAIYMAPFADAVAGVQWRTSGGTVILAGDTTNQRIGIRTPTPEEVLHTVGNHLLDRTGIATAMDSEKESFAVKFRANRWNFDLGMAEDKTFMICNEVGEVIPPTPDYYLVIADDAGNEIVQIVGGRQRVGINTFPSTVLHVHNVSDIGSGTPLVIFEREVPNDNTVQPMLRLLRKRTGSPGVGLGGSLEWGGLASLHSEFTDATEGAEKAKMVWSLPNGGGSITSMLELDRHVGTGDFDLKPTLDDVGNLGASAKRWHALFCNGLNSSDLNVNTVSQAGGPLLTLIKAEERVRPYAPGVVNLGEPATAFFTVHTAITSTGQIITFDVDLVSKERGAHWTLLEFPEFIAAVNRLTGQYYKLNMTPISVDEMKDLRAQFGKHVEPRLAVQRVKELALVETLN